MFAAKVEHLLGLGDTADARSGQTAAAHDESERRNGEWLGGRTDKMPSRLSRLR